MEYEIFVLFGSFINIKKKYYDISLILQSSLSILFLFLWVIKEIKTVLTVWIIKYYNRYQRIGIYISSNT